MLISDTPGALPQADSPGQAHCPGHTSTFPGAIEGAENKQNRRILDL